MKTELTRAFALELSAAKEQAQVSGIVHNDLGSLLSLLLIRVHRLEKHLPTGDFRLSEQCAGVTEITERAIQIAQRITTELNPGKLIENCGFNASLLWLIRDWQKRTDIALHIDVPQREIELSTQTARLLFRIFKEAIANAVRHSDASTILISVSKYRDLLKLQVSDNGKGIEEWQIYDHNSFGLTGLRERVRMLDGKCKIRGNPATGTTVTVEIPLLSL